MEELRERLYKVFDRAADRADGAYTNDSQRAENARAAAALATAIAVVDSRIDDKQPLKAGARLTGSP